MNGQLVSGLLILALLAVWVPHATGSGSGGVPCNMPPLDLPAERWTQVNNGDVVQLGPGQTFLTCWASEVVMRASRPFARLVTWEEDGLAVVGRVGEALIITVDREGPVEVAILGLSGEAYYSDGSRGTRNAGVETRLSRPSTIDNSEDELFADLAGLGWRRTAVGDRLSRWAMIWTQPDGKLEVELQGPMRTIGPENNVLDAKGNPTGKVRFRPNEYWILLSEPPTVGYITKIIGDVWVATDPTKVAAFFQRHGITHAWSRFPTLSALRSWYNQVHADVEELRKQDPSKAEQAWQEVLAREMDSRREWQEMLRQEELK